MLKRAKEIHSRIVTIDTHTDTPLLMNREGFDFSGENNLPRAKVDLKKMEEGGLDAAFFAVFIGQGDRTVEKYLEAHERALEIFNYLHTTINLYQNRSQIALASDDAQRLKKEGKRAIYIGVENGYPIGKEISILEQYYNLGARYLTLCHTRNNDICDSSNDPKAPEHGGVSHIVKEEILELNS